jgi:uncharacterized protein YjbJ (UPF0337 family)
MLYLRQSTASQSVLIGPFVDSTDGNTAETGLTIDAADIRLSKNGANIVGKNSGGGTHDELGYYTITLDATDTDTVGRLQLMVQEAGALPVYHEFWVLEEAVFDALFGASALGYVANAPVNVAQISADATAADNLEAALDGTGGVTITAAVTGNITGNLSGSVGSVTGAVGSVTGNVGGNVTGSVGSVAGAVASVTGNVGGNVTGSVGSLAAQAKADVNAEVVDALSTDTYAEPGQGTPGATIALAAKIGYLYKAWRNRHTQTASEYALYADDATTKDQEAVVSDDGTTFERGEISTGA